MRRGGRERVRNNLLSLRAQEERGERAKERFEIDSTHITANEGGEEKEREKEKEKEGER